MEVIVFEQIKERGEVKMANGMSEARCGVEPGSKCTESEITKEVPELINIAQNKMETLCNVIDKLGVRLMPISESVEQCVNECCDKNPTKTEVGNLLDQHVGVIDAMIDKVRSITNRLEI